MEFTGDLRSMDFSGSDLAGVVFREANLYQASFDAAVLQCASFLNCFAAEALFHRADCAGLRAIGTNFYRAGFRGANLHGALLWKCVLAGADLRGAELRGVTLTLDCNSFEEVHMDRVASLKLAYLITRARLPHQQRWLEILGAREVERLGRVFAR